MPRPELRPDRCSGCRSLTVIKAGTKKLGLKGPSRHHYKRNKDHTRIYRPPLAHIHMPTQLLFIIVDLIIVNILLSLKSSYWLKHNPCLHSELINISSNSACLHFLVCNPCWTSIKPTRDKACLVRAVTIPNTLHIHCTYCTLLSSPPWHCPSCGLLSLEEPMCMVVKESLIGWGPLRHLSHRSGRRSAEWNWRASLRYCSAGEIKHYNIVPCWKEGGLSKMSVISQHQGWNRQQ